MIKFLSLPLCLSLLLSLFACNLRAGDHRVFHTSVGYDLLAAVQNYEALTGSADEFAALGRDAAFMSAAESVNARVRASNLCNAWSLSADDRNDIDACIAFFESFDPVDFPAGSQGSYLDAIFEVKSGLVEVLKKLRDAGYEEYWHGTVFPKLKGAIDGYAIEEELLDNIHREIDAMAGGRPLSDDYSKIYILDVDNAFALNDETFCCTWRLLDKELAKRYRINFIQVYIHENLHRLTLPPALMERLDRLKADEFYRENESKAEGFGEGGNEAFVVAAETWISRRLGLKTDAEVYAEFTEYVDGTLVLAPIIYLRLAEKGSDEPYGDFLLRLFGDSADFADSADGAIRVGNVKGLYDSAMERIASEL
ncbi:MAG: hypothetical protein LBV38_05470 [Alistipes sp.]|jgi:hypothetical protein|nr:hypothetical protein [Alistipes sp.]